MADENLTKLAGAVLCKLEQLTGSEYSAEYLLDDGFVEKVEALGRDLGLNMDDNGEYGDEANPGHRMVDLLFQSLASGESIDFEEDGSDGVSIAASTFDSEIHFDFGIELPVAYEELCEKYGDLAEKIEVSLKA